MSSGVGKRWAAGEDLSPELRSGRSEWPKFDRASKRPTRFDDDHLVSKRGPVGQATGRPAITIYQLLHGDFHPGANYPRRADLNRS
jgi:hypothetical protein